MKDWLKIKTDQLLTVLLVSFPLALGMPAATDVAPCRDVSAGPSPPGIYADQGPLTISTTDLAGVRVEQDGVTYRAKSGERVRQPRIPASAQGIQRERSWDILRDKVIDQRHKKEPSLTFPRDDMPPPQN